MADESEERSEARISAELRARLARLAPDTPVRAVVLLHIDGAKTGTGRQSGAKRRAALDAARDAADRCLPEIEAALAGAGGRLLRQTVDVLGAVPVETTPAGIAALAECEQVRAVLEDQPLLLIGPHPNPPASGHPPSPTERGDYEHDVASLTVYCPCCRRLAPLCAWRGEG